MPNLRTNIFILDATSGGRIAKAYRDTITTEDGFKCASRSSNISCCAVILCPANYFTISGAGVIGDIIVLIRSVSGVDLCPGNSCSEVVSCSLDAAIITAKHGKWNWSAEKQWNEYQDENLDRGRKMQGYCNHRSVSNWRHLLLTCKYLCRQ